MSYHETDHPSIGRIRGVRKSDHVVQFLGVRYAQVEDRFARGHLCEYAPTSDGVIDATKIGLGTTLHLHCSVRPLGAIPPDSCEREQELIQKSLLPIPTFQHSDIDCLTLNISSPALKDTDHGVPVLVFVHGGAFTTGSSSYPQYDLGRITDLSVKLAMPIVAVGVNYRVGLPGFLHSARMKDAGYKPNNGLDDQRLALRWIQQHIVGFGGDPTRVTFLGESAGATSGFFHLHQQQPLFRQLVLMSGSPLLGLRPAQLVTESFKGAARALGIDCFGENQQLKILARIPTQKLVEATGRDLMVGPIVDGDVILESTTFGKLGRADEFRRLFPGQQNTARVLIGTCTADGTIWTSRLSQRTDIFTQTLEQCLSVTLSKIDTTLASKVTATYGIDTSATTNTKDNIQPVLQFGYDIAFARTATACAQALSSAGTDVFLYQFNCPNPWEGRWHQHATHVLDIAFLLQNYAEHLSQGQRQCAQTFASNIIEFVNEKPLWRKFDNDDPIPEVMIYDAEMDGDKDKSRLVTDIDRPGEHPGRRRLLKEAIGKDLLDKFADAWIMFLKGPSG